MKFNHKSFLNYLMVSTIFISSMIIPIAATQFEFYLFYLIYLFFILLFIVFQKGLSIQRVYFAWFLVICCISLIMATVSNLNIFLVVKQIIGIGFSSIAYYLLFKFNDYEVEGLFKIYINLAVLASILAIIQEISYLIGFAPGYDLKFIPFVAKHYESVGNYSGTFRVNALSPEPSNLAAILSPAVFFALHNLFFYKKRFMSKIQGAIVLFATLLTLSTVGFLGVLMTIIFISIKKLSVIFKGKRGFIGAVIVLTFVLPAIIVMPYFLIGEIKTRVDHGVSAIRGDYDQTNIRLMNITVFATYGNFMVAWKSFSENPILGTSLGTYAESFDKHFNIFFPGMGKINREEAGSLFLRLISETGLLGLIIVMYFIARFYLFPKNLSEMNFHAVNLILINNSLLILFVLRLVRQGHYFLDGFFFFIFMYYFSAKEFRRINPLRKIKAIPQKT